MMPIDQLATTTFSIQPKSRSRTGKPKMMRPFPAPSDDQTSSDEVDSAPVASTLPALPRLKFRCKWRKCGTKLHNLATLRGHVVKRHLSPITNAAQPEYICWWHPCEFLHKTDDGKVLVMHIFEDARELKKHVELEHIHATGREYGDGPSTTTDHYQATLARRRFLNDANGCEATPALPYDIPENSENPPRDVLELTPHYAEGHRTATGKADLNARKAFLKAHGRHPTDQRSLAEETLRAMVVRKQKLGPGIDRGGCTLINEARRATFQQAPGISRLIEADF